MEPEAHNKQAAPRIYSKELQLEYLTLQEQLGLFEEPFRCRFALEKEVVLPFHRYKARSGDTIRKFFP